VGIAGLVYKEPGKTFEQGVSQAMIAVLASPRFLFRPEQADAATPRGAAIATTDEYSLARRLPYLPWSAMPDGELFRLAARGGVLTQASVLMVTSNPTRTSPVKRGLFVLDNFLGTPTLPPPADLDIPNLDEAAKGAKNEPTMRDLLAMHRNMPLCASCHAR